MKNSSEDANDVEKEVVLPKKKKESNDKDFELEFFGGDKSVLTMCLWSKS